MRINQKIFALGLVSFISYASAAPTADTGGVALGMSVAEARGAAQKILKVQKDGVVQYTGTNQIGAYFVTEGSPNIALQHGIDYGSSYEGMMIGFSKNSQRVVTITRQQTFAKPFRPNPDTLIASLVKKYGEPSFLANNASGSKELFWQYNTNGSIEHWQNFAESNRCRPSSNNRSFNGFTFTVPEAFKADCGILIYVYFDNEANLGSTKLVERLNITLVDHQAAYADLKIDADARRKNQLEDDRKRLQNSKDIKVNL